MKSIVKTLSLLSIFAVIPGAIAATSRVSMVSRASPRLPSITGYLTSSSSTSTTPSTTSLWGEVDCINNYTDCITAEDVCGANFEECTTNVLFHAQMPKCLNVLYQCEPKGIESLFGTSNVSALSTIYSYRDDAKTEVDRYTYPLDGNVLGQRIIGGAIANKLTTEQCVRRYTSCLNRDDVCGADFELCTSQREFKKQAVLCASTLARCENEGKKELFGSVEDAAALRPSGEGARLVSMIEDGQQLAAMNAVQTCQRVTDNCLVSACLNNPWRCVEGTSMAKINAADFVGKGDEKVANYAATVALKHDENGYSLADDASSVIVTGTDIRKNLRAQCLETVGANKFCHMTYRENKPSNKDLMDLDLQEEVFSLAYAARKEIINTKIQEELKKFDTKAREACVDTITSCAMRSCGGGIGSVCYTEARTSKSSGIKRKIGDSGVQVNNGPYNDIKAGCEAIVNTDTNCIYAATADGVDGYNYSYINRTTFDTLFTKSDDTSTKADPIGVVAYLNSLLATSYNDAAIEQMKKQCQTVALSCVKSMCGKEYEYCYRNRTDVVSGSYETGAATFDRSMNKVGGVLDYNIVMGLCMNSVTSSPACEEHLKIAASTLRKESDKKSWYGTTTDSDGNESTFKYGSVREAWLDANSTTTPNKDVLVACKVGEANASDTCNENATMEPVDNKCIGILDEYGCMYSEPVYQVYSEYLLENAGKTLFQELLRNVEKEAQAKYNAKLTKEQHVCLAQNNGGVMGASENGSTFMWVKLNKKKVPSTYNVNGLKSSEFKASNDLYGSFCRARITVTSDDKMIQEELGKESTAYFAVGDSFTCGSWISSKTLEKITKKVGEQALIDEGLKVRNEKGQLVNSSATKSKYAWAGVIGLLGGGAIGTGLTQSGVINNRLDKSIYKMYGTKTTDDAKTDCKDYVTRARNAYNAGDVNGANSYASSALAMCNQLSTNSNFPCPGVSEEYSPSTYTTLRTSTADTRNAFLTSVDRMSTMVNNGAGKDAKEKDGQPYKKFTALVAGAREQYDPAAANDLMDKAVLECQDMANRVDSVISELCIFTRWTKNGSTPSSTTYIANGSNFSAYLTDLYNACENATMSDDEQRRHRAANIAIPIVSSVAGSVLASGITASVIKAQEESIQNEAVQRWMQEVGDHIKCYVGPDELGYYGDTISIEIE